MARKRAGEWLSARDCAEGFEYNGSVSGELMEISPFLPGIRGLGCSATRTPSPTTLPCCWWGGEEGGNDLTVLLGRAAGGKGGRVVVMA